MYNLCRSKRGFSTPELIKLLECGANPNYVATDESCMTPLHWMARKGRWLGFYYLTKAGADINALTNLLQTPLMLACDTKIIGPKLKIVDFLISQPTIKLNERDAGGASAINAAIFRNNIWIVRFDLINFFILISKNHLNR